VQQIGCDVGRPESRRLGAVVEISLAMLGMRRVWAMDESREGKEEERV
jgi:hypothetical protein